MQKHKFSCPINKSYNQKSLVGSFGLSLFELISTIVVEVAEGNLVLVSQEYRDVKVEFGGVIFKPFTYEIGWV